MAISYKFKFSPCIEMIFTDRDFYDRFAAVRAAGMDCLEFWGWPGRDIGRMKELCKRHGVRITSVTVGSDKGNGYCLVDRSTAPAFVAACVESIAVAKELDIPSLIVTVGQERDDITRYEQHANVVLACRAAAPLFEQSGVQLIIEPLNTLCNHLGYFLPSSYEAFEMIEEIGSPSVKVLYDIYHQQISEGNLVPTIRKYFNYIGHFHAADVPGRNQPGSGEINYRFVFEQIAALGYDKIVGLEYSPVGDSADTLRGVLELMG